MAHLVKKAFKIIEIGSSELVYDIKKNLPLITFENLYEKIKECHVAVGHSDRDKTWSEVKRRYAGIPQQAIDICIRMCDACQTRRSIPKPACGKPILSVGFLTRLQSDLIIINGRPRHPQSQGLVERANTVVQKSPVMLAINNCVSQSTQNTPCEMVFGQSLTTKDSSNTTDDFPIPLLSSDTCLTNTTDNTTQSSDKRIRDEAEKCYILTAVGLKISEVERTNTSPSILPCKIVDVLTKEDSSCLQYKLATLDEIINDWFSSVDIIDLSETLSAELRQLDTKKFSNVAFIQ
ncbi:unnamed protein product, partial [Rotaria socialis]